LNSIGDKIYQLCVDLFPICRSLTGNGVRKSLNIIKKHIPNLYIHEIPTGTKCFDWVVPKEWNISDAYITDSSGSKIVDFKTSNLHVVGYSTPIDKKMTLDDLKKHLYTLPEQPNAIPYITSYYKERWGFCITENQKNSLKEDTYHVVIRSTLEDGSLTYGEIILPGESSKEIFLSTYICHPSLANNELSGPSVLTYIIKWLQSLPNRYYTYRIIFIPETIGSILYLSKNIKKMKENIVGGYNLTCIGDSNAYSFLQTRKGDTLSDIIGMHVLRHIDPNYIKYSFLERGSDERQYNSPGIDLPIASIMRSKYGIYPEYHTSLDNLDFISSKGLEGGYVAVQKSIECFEHNYYPKTTVYCEPQLGKRGLYPTLSTKETAAQVRDMMNLIAYSDGMLSLVEICQKIEAPLWKVYPILEKLVKEQLIDIKRVPF
jgi:aminopeptidase-like protein